MRSDNNAAMMMTVKGEQAILENPRFRSCQQRVFY